MVRHCWSSNTTWYSLGSEKQLVEAWPSGRGRLTVQRLRRHCHSKIEDDVVSGIEHSAIFPFESKASQVLFDSITIPQYLNRPFLRVDKEVNPALGGPEFGEHNQ